MSFFIDGKSPNIWTFDLGGGRGGGEHLLVSLDPEVESEKRPYR